jgi:YVTN family beta-propeller protein
MRKQAIPALVAIVVLAACGGDYGANVPFDPGSPIAQPGIFYISNADSDDVTVVNAATTEFVSATCLGISANCLEPRNLVVSADRSSVFVPFRNSNTLARLPAAAPVVANLTPQIAAVAESPDFNEPYAAAVTPDGDEVWVVNKEGGGSSTGSVTVLNASSLAVLTTIVDPCFSSPEGIAIANGKAYVANRGANDVCVVDVATRAFVASVAVTGSPRFAVATPDGQLVYVGSSSDVVKIDTDTDTVAATINVSARNLAAHPDGTRIYVGTQSSDIGIISVATDALTTINVPVASSIYAVAISSDGAVGMATDESRDVAYVFDAATDTLALNVLSQPVEVPTGSTPRAIAGN